MIRFFQKVSAIARFILFSAHQFVFQGFLRLAFSLIEETAFGFVAQLSDRWVTRGVWHSRYNIINTETGILSIEMVIQCKNFEVILKLVHNMTMLRGLFGSD